MFEITRKLLIGSLAAFLMSAVVTPSDAETFTPSRFTVEVRGQGPDVIFIPGLGSSRDVWTAQADALSATHRSHLVQINGFAGQQVGAQVVHAVAGTQRLAQCHGKARPSRVFLRRFHVLPCRCAARPRPIWCSRPPPGRR